MSYEQLPVGFDDHAAVSAIAVNPNSSTFNNINSNTRKSSRRLLAVDVRLNQVKIIFAVLFVIQFAVMIAWSTLLYHRFALTADFSQYQQGIWEIHHGYLNPPDNTSLSGGGGLWGNSGQIIFWLLAIVTWLTPNGMVLLYLQDVFVVLTEVVVFVWAYEIINSKIDKNQMWRPALVGLTGLILIVNPWNYWVVSWDIHSEPFCTIFCVLAARALYYKRWKSLTFWVILTLTGGMVECEYIVALGLLAITLSKSYRNVGLMLFVAGAGWFGTLDYVLHAASSFPPPGQVYGYLTNAPQNGQNLTLQQIVAKIAVHPGRLVEQLWIERFNVIAVVSAGGILGFFNRWGFFVPIVTMMTNTLSRAFAIVAFQNFPAFPFLTIGTIMFLVSVLAPDKSKERRNYFIAQLKTLMANLKKEFSANFKFENKYKFSFKLKLPTKLKSKIVAGIAVVIAVNCIIWSIVWTAPVKDQWLTISNAAATVLTQAIHEIPTADEVVVSQGVAGRFSKRVNVVVPTGQKWVVPFYGKTIWWVLAPTQGIELTNPNVTYGIIGSLTYSLHAQLVMQGGGIWVFKLNRNSHQHSFTSSLTSYTIPGWVVPGVAGKSDLSGNSLNWHTQSTGKSGYVITSAYWQEQPGQYQIALKMSVTGTANVQVWNSTANELVAQRYVPGTGALQTFTYDFGIFGSSPASAYSGWGPYRILPIEPSQENQFEIRIEATGGTNLSVYSLTFKPVTP